MIPTMRLSAKGIAFLEQFEGVVLQPYQDVVGLWTVGVGHLLHPDELKSGKILVAGEPLAFRPSITREQAEAILRQDLSWSENTVSGHVTVELTQSEYDALVCFCFNVGGKAFLGSTLLKKLNTGRYQDVPDQLMRWTKAGGKEIAGLVNRRRGESQLWNGVYDAVA